MKKLSSYVILEVYINLDDASGSISKTPEMMAETVESLLKITFPKNEPTVYIKKYAHGRVVARE